MKRQEEIERILRARGSELREKYGVCKIKLFDSWARGERCRSIR
ncbi:hypothetical protein [Thermoflexus sp.]|nr:hypothetical protein [Thermoflexus sp.]